MDDLRKYCTGRMRATQHIRRSTCNAATFRLVYILILVPSVAYIPSLREENGGQVHYLKTFGELRAYRCLHPGIRPAFQGKFGGHQARNLESFEQLHKLLQIGLGTTFYAIFIGKSENRPQWLAWKS